MFQFYWVFNIFYLALGHRNLGLRLSYQRKMLVTQKESLAATGHSLTACIATLNATLPRPNSTLLIDKQGYLSLLFFKTITEVWPSGVLECLSTSYLGLADSQKDRKATCRGMSFRSAQIFVDPSHFLFAFSPGEVNDGTPSKSSISVLYLRSLDILGNDVHAADVDHVKAAADDKTPLVEVLPMSLAQGGVQSGVLKIGNHRSSSSLSSLSSL